MLYLNSFIYFFLLNRNYFTRKILNNCFKTIRKKQKQKLFVQISIKTTLLIQITNFYNYMNKMRKKKQDTPTLHNLKSN